MKKFLLTLAAFFCLLLIVIGVLLAAAKPNVDVPLEIAKGLISLAVATLIIGGLSYILSERARKQTQQAEIERLLVDALRDLKAAYEKIRVAQFRLIVDPSPIKLTEQIEVFVEARTRLQHVRFERLVRDDKEVYDSISRMISYIRILGEEYAKNFTTVSHACIAFERDTQCYPRGETDSAPSVQKLDMKRFPYLRGFLEQFPESEFEQGYAKARSWMENKLSALHAALQ